MKRSIVVTLLLFSPLFMMLGDQSAVVAAPVTTTTTQTTTTLLTLTETGATTLYQTLTEFTSVQTVTGTTYTSTRVVAVPVQVVTTVVSPSTQTIYGMGEGCDLQGHCVTSYDTQTHVNYVTQTGVVLVYSPAVVQSTVTSQYLTSVPTTVFSTSATTSTYATGQVVSVTNTEIFTSVTEVQPAPLSISDMLSQNLLIAVVLVGLVLGVLGFMFGRRGGRGPSRIHASGFCASCGSRIPQDAQFCPKCGEKRISV